MMIRRLAAFALVILVFGCTSVIVQPVNRSANIKHVCIQENPKVWVKDFVPVLQEGFERHGISSEVFQDVASDDCEFFVTYTALQTWDFATYMTHAEVRLNHMGQQIAYGEFHLKGDGGLALNKWRGTRSKMNPVIDQLLAAY
jgi:hypothetical protein